jgi:hypothetical protein
MNKVSRLKQAIQEQGTGEAFRRSLEFLLREMHYRVTRDPANLHRTGIDGLLTNHNVNLCYNTTIPKDYEPSMSNILIATESPAVVEHEGWIDPQMEFSAEISLGNYFDLDNYFCPREIYAGRDSFVRLNKSKKYSGKSELVSMVFSSKTELPGHKLRHDASDNLGPAIDSFGSGANRYVKQKRTAIENHMFEVVIENGKYEEYVSEKFYDPLKTMTIPIYRGGETAVRKMGFDTDGIIFFDTLGELEEIVDSLSRERYQQLRPKTEYNRKRLIEIRNRLKNELYLARIRPGYLTSRNDDGSMGYHLAPESSNPPR